MQNGAVLGGWRSSVLSPLLRETNLLQVIRFEPGYIQPSGSLREGLCVLNNTYDTYLTQALDLKWGPCRLEE